MKKISIDDFYEIETIIREYKKIKRILEDYNIIGHPLLLKSNHLGELWGHNNLNSIYIKANEDTYKELETICEDLKNTLNFKYNIIVE